MTRLGSCMFVPKSLAVLGLGLLSAVPAAAQTPSLPPLPDLKFAEIPPAARQVAMDPFESGWQAFCFVISGDYDGERAGQSARLSMSSEPCEL